MDNIDDFEIFNGELLGYNGKDQYVRIPHGVKTITFRTFYGSRICGVEIPQSVECIDVQAFLCCHNLKYIVIPKSVTIMDTQIFEDCDNLTDIFLEVEKGVDMPHWAYDWNCCCNAAVHYLGEWEYVDGIPKAKNNK
ncbi:MAG: leucine-rich repeat domain-containing protein [Clostridiales bacterium]|nr:leucine-rich repeat domain-containing protein [Clostridiales bacterium]